MLPPYGHAVKKTLAKNSDRLVVVRYGRDGWTHAAVENDNFITEAPNPQTIMMPVNKHWTEFWWPLKNARIWIDWPMVARSECYAFADYLVETVKAREVYYYDSKLDKMRKFKCRNLV